MNNSNYIKKIIRILTVSMLITSLLTVAGRGVFADTIDNATETGFETIADEQTKNVVGDVEGSVPQEDVPKEVISEEIISNDLESGNEDTEPKQEISEVEEETVGIKEEAVETEEETTEEAENETKEDSFGGKGKEEEIGKKPKLLMSSGMLLGATGDVASVTIGSNVSYYKTIDAAITAANSATADCEIKLLANCVASAARLTINNSSYKKVTLNLDRYTLEIKGNYGDTTTNGALNINTPVDIKGDSSNTGKLRFTNHNYGLVTLSANAKVNMYAGTNVYINNDPSSYTAESRVITIANSGSMNIYGGAVYTEKANRLSEIVCNSVVNIYDGYFQWKPSDTSWGGSTDAYQSGKISIYGGYYDGLLWCGNTSNMKNNYFFVGGYYTDSGINTTAGIQGWSDCIEQGVQAVTLSPPIVKDGVSYNYRIKAVECSAVSASAAMGTATVDKQSLKVGDIASFSATPKTGYKFKNWTNSAGTQVSTSASFTYTVQSSDSANGVKMTAHFEPIAPTGLVLSAVTNSSMTISWDSPVPDYFLYIATDASFNNCISGYSGKAISTSSTTTSHTVSGLSAGTTYYVRVAAKNPETGGVGPFSTAVSEKTLFMVAFSYCGHGTDFDVMGKADSYLKTAVGTKWNSVLAPTAPGCVFIGWYSDSSYSMPANLSDTTTITKDCTYYAKWHEHAWKYESIPSETGGKIVAYCTNPADKCSYYGTEASHSDSIYVEMIAADAVYTGNAYSDSNITLTGDSNFNTVTEQSIGKPDVKYYTDKACTNPAVGAPINVGKYYAKLAVMTGTTEAASIVSEFDITKAPSSVTLDPTAVDNLIYTGSPMDLLNAGTASGGTMMYSSPNDATAYLSVIPKAKAAGTYSIYYYVEGDSNHSDTTKYGPISITISKKNRDTITVSMDGYTYEQNDSVPAPTVSPSRESLPEQPEVTFYYNTENNTTSGTVWPDNITSSTLDVKTYYMYAKIAETDNYNACTTETCEFTVSRTDCTITADPSARDLTYNGEAQALATAGHIHGGTLKYSLTQTGEYSENIPVETNAGSYTVYYKGYGDRNHTDSEVGSVKVEIKKAASSIDTDPVALSPTYTGLSLPLISGGTATGGQLMYSFTSGTDYSENTPEKTDVDTYTIYYYVKGDDNHLDSSERNLNASILKADCTVTAPQAKTLVYTREAQELVTAGTVIGGHMEYSLTGEDGSFSKNIPTGTAKKDYTVYYRIIGDSNHKDIPSGEPVNVSIGKATRPTIVVKMDGYTYGQTAELPTPDTDPAASDPIAFEEGPDVKFFYNTSGSNTGGTEWNDMTSPTLNAGTYYMYATVTATESYQEYTTDAKAFEVSMTSDYDVEAPIGKLTYRQTLAQATLEGGSAYVGSKGISGDFDWKDDTVKAIMPNVSDSDSTLYDMMFTPSGDDADNYVPKACQSKIVVTPKEVKPTIDAKADDAGNITETITDDDGAVLNSETDYDREVTSISKNEYTEYAIKYTFKDNYSGIRYKKLLVPKSQKGLNPDDVIISSVEAEKKAESEFSPEMKPVSYSDAKIIINKDIEKISTDSVDPRQPRAQAIIEKLASATPDDVVYDARISLEMTALDEQTVDAGDKEKVLEEADNLKDINEDIRYIDVTVYLTYTVTDVKSEKEVVRSKEKIPDTGDKAVAITITAPDDLHKIASGYKRTYYIVRVHDDESQVIAQSTSPTITFSSSLFSTYALMFKDTKIPEEDPIGGGDDGNSSATPVVNTSTPILLSYSYGFVSPKMGDSYEVYALFGILFAGVLLLLSGLKRKRIKQ